MKHFLGICNLRRWEDKSVIFSKNTIPTKNFCIEIQPKLKHNINKNVILLNVFLYLLKYITVLKTSSHRLWSCRTSGKFIMKNCKSN